MSEIRADKLHNVTGDNDSGIDLSTNDVVAIDIAGSEKARMDSSGNLLVGTTTILTAENDVAGISLASGSYGGLISASRDGGRVATLNRSTSDGEIISLRRGGTAIGILGSSNTDQLVVGTPDGSEAGFRFDGDLQQIIPATTTGAKKDNLVDFGSSSARFDDIFATNSTIQTSDQQEKNTIEDSDLGLDFVKRLSPKSYIFNGKTRTHYGLIAQDVETVLSNINKPTTGFAGFIKDDISEEQDGSQYRYGLRYTEFVAPLIKAIKEQQTIIEDLQARIEALENA